MNEKEMARALMEALEAYDCDDAVRQVIGLQEAGLKTQEVGFYVRLASKASFKVVVTQLRAGRARRR